MTSVKLADTDIWDDSALIRSWDEALEEYKKYHSIHACGQKIEDVLDEHELAQLRWYFYTNSVRLTRFNGPRERNVQQNGGNTGSEEVLNDANIMTEETNGGPLHDAAVATEIENEEGELIEHPVQPVPEDRPAEATTTSFSSTINVPQTLLGTVQDEALKNLLMAWYYAGYYTGLHEGQQIAKST